MIKNLNDNTLYIKKYEDNPAGNSHEWMAIASLISVIVFLGYFIFG
ncbi:MAG: hypothetical protein WAW10_11425 [Gallionella sp.]